MPRCAVCGQDNPGGFRFCGACGTPLTAPTQAPAEERRLVTVLFCDLVGFTARSDQADPEDVGAFLRPYHARQRAEIERLGGTLDKFIGDGVMAVFGAPVAHEDDPERAVRCALGMLAAIEELNQEASLDLDGPPPLPDWPDGVQVRTFDREADARAVHRLVQDAFADIGDQPRRSYEFWVETHLERSDFDPSLWFLATDGGELVGANLAQSGPLGGYVAQLAVRRDQRGRGLGLALLRHGFSELHRRGVREVYLHVDSENRTGATRLYERAGMRVQHRSDSWMKTLR